MSLTTVTITGTFENEDGTPAQGSVTAVLSEQIQNGTLIVEPVPILGRLNAEGKLVNQAGAAFTLVANDDTGTEPKGSRYQFTVTLSNAPVRTFDAVVSHLAAGGKVDLSELEV